MLDPDKCLYTPYYCEENIWQLSRLWCERFPKSPAAVVFISNFSRQCALWHQKPGAPGEPVIWDYHVVLIAEVEGVWQVFDFDSRLPWPNLLTEYLGQTFRADTRPELQPLFRVIPCEQFVTCFSSDRRHMRCPDGGWLQPAPEWQAIFDGKQHNLEQFVAMRKAGPGVVYDLDQLRHMPVI